MARASTRRERSDHPPWPRGHLRDPIRSDPDYLHLRSLRRLLKETAERELWGREGLILVDVGCDEKPYYPYFAPFVAEYRGVDVGPRSSGGGSGRAERLNFQDASVDVILCTQVLEHTDDPIEAVKEFRRVLKADGVAFVSTHGTYVYHPAPTYDDYWRWTGPGLEKLFRDFGGFEIVDVYSCGGSFSCLSSLLGVYANYRLSKYRVLQPLRPLTILLPNMLGAFLDDRFPHWSNPRMLGALIANFLVIAKKDERS